MTAQQDLFTIQAVPAQRRAYRLTDPDTSRQAAIRANRASNRQIVLDAVMRYPGRTAGELHQIITRINPIMDYHEVVRRLSELGPSDRLLPADSASRPLRVGEARICSVRGNPARVWIPR